MPKLSINTKASLYEPVEIVIDGKIFELQRITRKELNAIGKLDEEVKNGNLDAAYQRLEVLFGPSKSFDKLDISQIGQILKFVIQEILNPKPIEKNVS